MKWPFDYVTSYGRVWRKGKESEDWSVFCLGIGCVCVGVGVRVWGGGGGGRRSHGTVLRRSTGIRYITYIT